MYNSNILESTGDFNDFVRSNLTLRSSEVKKDNKTRSIDILTLNGNAAVFSNEHIKITQKTPRSSKESASKSSSSLTAGKDKERESLSFQNDSSPIRSLQQNSVCKSYDPIIGGLNDHNFPHLVHSWRRHIPQQDLPNLKEFKSTQNKHAHIIQKSINNSTNIENLVRGNHDRVARVFSLWRDGFKERAIHRTEAMHRAMILQGYYLLTSSFRTWAAISKAIRFEQVCFFF